MKISGQRRSVVEEGRSLGTQCSYLDRSDNQKTLKVKLVYLDLLNALTELFNIKCLTNDSLLSSLL